MIRFLIPIKPVANKSIDWQNLFHCYFRKLLAFNRRNSSVSKLGYNIQKNSSSDNGFQMFHSNVEHLEACFPFRLESRLNRVGKWNQGKERERASDHLFHWRLRRFKHIFLKNGSTSLMPNVQVPVGGRRLFIVDTSRANAGTYECIVRNSAGENSKKTTLRVLGKLIPALLRHCSNTLLSSWRKLVTCLQSS